MRLTPDHGSVRVVLIRFAHPVGQRLRDPLMRPKAFLNRCETHQVGGRTIMEYWILLAEHSSKKTRGPAEMLLYGAVAVKALSQLTGQQRHRLRPRPPGQSKLVRGRAPPVAAPDLPPHFDAQ